MSQADFSIAATRSTQLAASGAIQLPLVSFILVAGPDHALDPVLAAIQMQDYPRIEAVIVDVPSSSGTLRAIPAGIERDPRFTVVRPDGRLCAIERAAAGLRSAKGGFVAFLDGSASPHPNFASTHIQVHLASRHSVPVTISGFVVADTVREKRTDNGVANRSGGDLVACNKAIRLSCLDDAAYAVLSDRTMLVPPEAPIAPGSVGSCALYRRFVIDLLHPIGARADLEAIPISEHYQPLCQWLGGSATIDILLASPSGNSPDPALALSDGKSSTAMSRAKVGIWAANGLDFSQRIGPARYWGAMAAMLGLPHDNGEMAEPAEIVVRMDGQLPLLVAAFGERQAIHALDTLLPRPVLLAVLRRQHGPRLPLRIHGAVRCSSLRQMHERVRLFLRARRVRRRRAAMTTG